MARVTYRPAEPADADELTQIVASSFADYRSFAPPGWQPPPPEPDGGRILDRLLLETTWCELAEADGAIAGHAQVIPAALARRPVDDPRLAHVVHLFVRPPYWGTGIALELHRRALGAMRERGFTGARLDCAAGQSRARRFYEREGWLLERDEHEDPGGFGLPIVEYRRGLSDVR